MDYKMTLTPEQLDILNGSEGEAMAKVMKTLVLYGEAFGAEKMVPVTSAKGHLVTSFGLKVMKPVYNLMDQLIEGGALSRQQFTVDPKPLDDNVPAGILEKLVFKKFMYTMQDSYDSQLKKLGLIDESSYTCTCYMDEVGNAPKKGEYLSWAESSAVVYANSVLGARCNRNSGMLDLFGAIGHEEYSLASVIADDKGQLYYKNDSNAIFAIKKSDKIELGKGSGLKLAASGRKVTAKFTKDKQANRYRVLYRLNNKGTFKTLYTSTTTRTFTVPNSSLVTVRVRPEYIDAAKAVLGNKAATADQLTKANADLTAAKAALVEKAANTITASNKTVTLKASKLKKKAQTVKVSKAFAVKSAQGTVTYKKTSGNKKITVSKAGKVTVKKGLKKGTYSVKVTVSASGDGSHKAGTKNVTLKVKVK